MKLSQQELDAHLANKLAPVYLIGGDELLLVDEVSTAIGRKAKKQGYDESIKFIVDTHTDFSLLKPYTDNLSLLGNKRVLEIRVGQPQLLHQLIDFLLGKHHTSKQQLLIIFISPKLGSKYQNKAWFKQIDKLGVILDIKPISPQYLGQWLKTRLKAYGLTADWPQIQRLAECVQGNLVAATQAVEKLYLHYGSCHLSAEDIGNSLSDNSRYTIFQLVDHTLLGNPHTIINTLAKLREMDTEPGLIVWALTRQLRTLAKISYQRQHKSASLEKLFTTFQVWPRHRKLMEKVLAKHPSHFFQAQIQLAASIDAVMKGSRVGHVWDELTKMCLFASEIKQKS